MGALEASPREFGGALEALWTRLDAAGASRRGPGSPKWKQNRYKIWSKRVSVTVSGPDHRYCKYSREGKDSTLGRDGSRHACASEIKLLCQDSRLERSTKK